ncbi:MAG: kinase/pyrophosphorylase [Chromatiales bacterium]|nr:kinase/pyrophosphorylase [Chromatiales bacterium]
MTRRTVFFLSDQTGVTAETLGRSLLTQFEDHDYEQVTLPFIDTEEKALAVVRQINELAATQGSRPIVFSTLVRDEIRECFRGVSGLFLDLFSAFVETLEREFEAPSIHAVGRTHGRRDSDSYERRIEAMNYALTNDDGMTTRDFGRAELILLGVSRTGKTPTCLYLALAYGVFAANYPLADDDLDSGRLPRQLEPYRRKLYGLTISPERLQQIRRERRPTGRYASAEQVRFELRASSNLFQRYDIPFLDVSESSIEEIASRILSITGIERRIRP